MQRACTLIGLGFRRRSRLNDTAQYPRARITGGPAARTTGAPGEGAYHPGYYPAFALDPGGNNIKAVYHGEAGRSAASVSITF